MSSDKLISNFGKRLATKATYILGIFIFSRSQIFLAGIPFLFEDEAALSAEY